MKAYQTRFYEAILQDIRYGLRSLARSPGFAGVAVLLLALGIGANTAVFSIVDGIFLKSLPVWRPEQLVIVAISGPRGPNTRFSYPMYQDFRNRNEVFAGILAHHSTPLSLSVNGQAERALGQLVSGNYFSVLGVSAFTGRTFTQEDDITPGGHPVVVLSYGFWQRRFGSDPDIVGKKISLNNYPFTVIGVTPPDFMGVKLGSTPDICVPLMMEAQIRPGSDALNSRNTSWLEIMARLKPGVGRLQAQTSLNVLFQQILQMEYQGRITLPQDLLQQILKQQIELMPGNRGWSELRRQFSEPLLVIVTLVGFVLLITCANIANLLLVRAVGRRKEIAIRLAMGASRRRLIQQLLIESIVLSIAGGASGLFLAFWLRKGLLQILPQEWPLTALRLTTDLRVISFTVIASVLTGIIFGLVPALQSTHPDLSSTLKDQTSVLETVSARFSLKKVLVVAQIALSLILLIGASIFVRSLRNLRELETGFRRENVITMALDPSLNGYNEQRIKDFYQQLLERLETLHNVQAASMASMPLLSGRVNRSTVAIQGYQPKPGEDMQPDLNVVSPRFFETLGIPIMLGRNFQPQDDERAPRVAIINQAMARYFFQGENPVGKRFGFGKKRSNEIEIIGVAGDVKLRSLREEALRVVYVPAKQFELKEMTLYVRTIGEPQNTIAAIRQEIRSLDKELPIYNILTLEEQVAKSLTPETLVATLSSLFGALALLLASLGLYGVIAYTVKQRTKEIGIRIAMGAQQANIIWLILREATVLVLLGVLAGIPIAFLLSRLVSSLLYGISTFDLISVLLAIAVVGIITILAGYLPALRATKIDPLATLRYE